MLISEIVLKETGNKLSIVRAYGTKSNIANSLVGINLGGHTTVSSIMNNDGKLIVINKTPSVISIDNENKILVGQDAINSKIKSSNKISFLKRLIGRKFNDPLIEKDKQLLKQQIKQGPNNEINIKLNDKLYTPTQLTSFILKDVKKSIDKNFEIKQCDDDDKPGDQEQQLVRAIITVPSFFNDEQRIETRDAGLMAGFRVDRIISESYAPLLARRYLENSYGGSENGKIYAVYDFGGSVFSISILKYEDGVYETISNKFDFNVGGRDFDNEIIEFIFSEFKKQYPTTCNDNNNNNNNIKSFIKDGGEDDGISFQKLRNSAELAKCNLSISKQTEIILSNVFIDPNSISNGCSTTAKTIKEFKCTLTRDHFEKIVKHYIHLTEEHCKSCLSDANLTIDDIEQVILVGGLCNMPKVIEQVKHIFKKDPWLNNDNNYSPNELISIGAAIQGGSILL